jgi:hypothetical protein
MNSKCFKFAWIVFFFFSVHAFATSVVIVATVNGIVVGADTKGVPSGESAPNALIKVRLLRKKFIVACLGTEFLKRSDGIVFYDFPIWISKVDKSLSTKISVRDLADKIKQQVTVTFAPFAVGVKAGEITKEKFPTAFSSDYLVQYIAAGFDKGKPIAYKVSVKINWKSKSIEAPEQVPLGMNKGLFGNLWIDPEGINDAVTEIGSSNSEQYKKFASRVPREALAVKARDYLSLDGASNVVRAYLGMETEAHPRLVGFPITVVTVPADGDGWVETYKTDVLRP